MTQVVEIEKYWNGTKFCCPVCGCEVFGADGEPASAPCEHVVFSWISEVDEYYNPSRHVQQIVENAEECDELLPSPFDEEFQQGLPENTVLFGMTEYGMACGPVSLTVVHAINFPQAEEFDL